MITVNFKNGESVTIDETRALIRGSKELTFYISNRKVVVPVASVKFPISESIKNR
ncbi:MAG: hypothetical protein ACI971_002133 [Colwellia sp.]|jgi:hypothetical protein